MMVLVLLALFTLATCFAQDTREARDWEWSDR
jgi:hypothetical protein